MRRVIKVGGSLLLRGDLIESLERWLLAQSDAENLVIVGGGELIDAIRKLDRVHNDSAEQTHWTCVDLLDVTADIASRWFNWSRIQTPEQFKTALERGIDCHRPVLVNVTSFYNRYVQDTYDVPCDWRTTSDTIAALLAIRVDADELVLLKSCPVDPGATIEQLVESEIVDESLPTIAPHVNRIRVEELA